LWQVLDWVATSTDHDMLCCAADGRFQMLKGAESWFAWGTSGIAAFLYPASGQYLGSRQQQHYQQQTCSSTACRQRRQQ